MVKITRIQHLIADMQVSGAAGRFQVFGYADNTTTEANNDLNANA
jgi:hypothetical protein